MIAAKYFLVYFSPYCKPMGYLQNKRTVKTLTGCQNLFGSNQQLV
jgi:hypothetical protein